MKTLSNTLDWIDSIEAGNMVLIFIICITAFMVFHAIKQWKHHKAQEEAKKRMIRTNRQQRDLIGRKR